MPEVSDLTLIGKHERAKTKEED